MKPNDLYPVIPTYQVEIKSRINDFADFAKEHGITYRELKDLNPWLRDSHLSNAHGRSYSIDLPQKGAFGVLQDDSISFSQTIKSTTH